METEDKYRLIAADCAFAALPVIEVAASSDEARRYIAFAYHAAVTNPGLEACGVMFGNAHGLLGYFKGRCCGIAAVKLVIQCVDTGVDEVDFECLPQLLSSATDIPWVNLDPEFDALWEAYESGGDVEILDARHRFVRWVRARLDEDGWDKDVQTD